MNSHMEVEVEGIGNGFSVPSNDCFDCNICLELAVDPVVTLCGHLYCWPCIYKWLQIDNTSPRQCPVCKSSLSLSSLVPLYSRGCSTNEQAHQRLFDIPRPPKYYPARNNSHRIRAHGLRNQNGPYYGPYGDSLRVWGVAGGISMGVLSRMSGDQEGEEPVSVRVSRRYYDGDGGGTARGRPEEAEVVSCLHRIWVFLFCFVVLYVLLF